ncbi:MAG: hypothetical protein IT175_06200 [Acidobacteria bacterium]|nr:hypothetical protein [Acidobacteriota bacterium]
MDNADWTIYANDLRFLHTPPACVLERDANQNIAYATDTAITFTTETADTDGMHSNVSNTSRITFQTAGRYFTSGLMGYAQNLTSARRAYIYKNGTTFQVSENMPDTADGLAYLNPHTTDYYTASTYVELMAYQLSGGTLAVTVATFAASWVGA